MINEDKSGFFSSWQEDLEKVMEQLKKEKQEEIKKYEGEMKEIIKKELIKVERKNDEKINQLEKKVKKIYYWLYGIILAFLVAVKIFLFFR